MEEARDTLGEATARVAEAGGSVEAVEDRSRRSPSLLAAARRRSKSSSATTHTRSECLSVSFGGELYDSVLPAPRRGTGGREPELLPELAHTVGQRCNQAGA
jgi:hypothetical protein